MKNFNMIDSIKVFLEKAMTCIHFYIKWVYFHIHTSAGNSNLCLTETISILENILGGLILLVLIHQHKFFFI